MSTNIIQRFRNTSIPVADLKFSIFAPVEKISNKKDYAMEHIVYEDDLYKVIVSGVRLTQVHRDILDIALCYGKYDIEDEIEDEGIAIRTFSLHTIQKYLNHKKKNNQAWLKNKFQELKRATILIYDKKFDEDLEFNIIRVAKRSHKLNEFVLVFEELYLAMFEKQVAINYDKLLTNILNLRFAQTKAVVRYFLSFSDKHQINIDNLLRKLGIQGDTKNLEYHRRLVLKELQGYTYIDKKTKEKVEIEGIANKFNIELIKTTSDNRKNSDITLKYFRHKDVIIDIPSKNR